MDINIHELIDEAIEKKDRYVSIFISETVTSVTVYPLEDEVEEWLPVELETPYESCRCPKCGHGSHNATPYCSVCGTQLRLPNRKEK